MYLTLECSQKFIERVLEMKDPVTWWAMLDKVHVIDGDILYWVNTETGELEKIERWRKSKDKKAEVKKEVANPIETTEETAQVNLSPE